MRAGHVGPRTVFGDCDHRGRGSLGADKRHQPGDEPGNGLRADSLDLLEILFRLQQQFGADIALPIREAATVENLARYLQEHVPQTVLATFEI